MPRSVAIPRIHLTAPASCAKNMLAELRIEGGVPGLVRAIQTKIGDGYRVTANPKMLLAHEDEFNGGRTDDEARLTELHRTFADDHVAALVTVRGGAWFARLLNRIRWDLLKRRRKPLYIFGFSEITPLVLIAGAYPRVVGIYDLGPGFLSGGMRRWARQNLAQLTAAKEPSTDWQTGFAAGYAAAKYREAFLGFFTEVADVLEGRGTARQPTGRLLSGKLADRQIIRIVGGNLSLLVAMLGSPYLAHLETRGKWLAIEDVNESCEQIDRMIAGLALAGLLERADGIILGDFHKDDTEQAAAVCKLLKHHLPPRWNGPIVQLDNFGHIYPIAPLPMQRPVELRVTQRKKRSTSVSIHIPWASWK